MSYPEREGHHLTNEAEAAYHEFLMGPDQQGCICFLGHPPCGWCTDEGNPLNINECDDCWIPNPPDIAPEDVIIQ